MLLMGQFCVADTTAACANDAECSGCAAISTGSGTGGGTGAELHPGHNPWGGDLHHPFQDPFGWFVTRAPEPGTRCEDLGAHACLAFSAPDDSHGGATERGRGDLASDRCMGNPALRRLLACRMASTGCDPRVAPCLSPDEDWAQDHSFLSLSGGKDGDHATRLPAIAGGRGVAELAGEDRASPPPPSSHDAQVDDADIAHPNRSVTGKHHRRLATSSDPLESTPGADGDSTCDGILEGSVCCGASCGECGGNGCSSRGNGAEDCCAASISASGVFCSDTGGAAPCIVDGKLAMEPRGLFSIS